MGDHGDMSSTPSGESDRSADRPWMMRTYSGHSTARASNELYRTNLAKGQTGLSIAFDLPTQTGYDPDDPRSRGEVGKVGVPVAELGHMRELLEGWADTEEEHSYPGGYQHRLLNAVDDLHAQIEQWAWADLPAWPDL